MDEDNEKKNTSFPAKTAINYVLGLLEILLAFRLILKLLGANPASGFVTFIYSLTQIFLAPFTAIFRPAIAQGLETKAVLEPATIIAMIVYALIAWGLIKLILAFKGRDESKV